ncbi:hypothetical protein DFH06DRAFT_1129452 [Mycena polygramma]|nr:hypothetical protein DFH06DRAFT_1129452 [Mycena polygramma]
MATAGSPDDVLNRGGTSDEARIGHKGGETACGSQVLRLLRLPQSQAGYNLALYMIDRGDDGEGEPRIKRLEWDEAVAAGWTITVEKGTTDTAVDDALEIGEKNGEEISKSSIDEDTL